MSINANTNFYYDANSLNGLRAQARKDSGKALEGIAKQFESMFMKMMLKSMRDASVGDELMGSEHQQFFRGMYDDQLVQELSKNGSIGLADVLVKQLSAYLPENQKKGKQLPNYEKLDSSSESNFKMKNVAARKAVAEFIAIQGLANGKVVSDSEVKTNSNVTAFETQPITVDFPEVSTNDGNAENDNTKKSVADSLSNLETPDQFVDAVWSSAQQAADELGVAPMVLIAQAALETGWGKHVLRHSDGSSSNNLFNVKASSAWHGERVKHEATEYIKGVRIKDESSFRSYDDIEQSFNDYVSFIKSNPRYQKALAKAADAGQYIDELHKAGYATDPEYSMKIKRVLNSDAIANASIRLQNNETNANGVSG